MTAGQKAFLCWLSAALLFVVGWTFMAWSNSDELTEGWGIAGAVIWFASFPAAIFGVYYLIRAAVHPDS